jgi:tripartite ATP-independent transporter DctM subunit
MAIGAVDMLIPPSALTVLLGSLSGISISKLLIGGVVPGLILSLAFVGYIVVRVKTRPELAPATPIERKTGWARYELLVLYVLPLASIFVVVVGAMLAGYATPTESAALGALATIALAAVYRVITVDNLMRALRGTVAISGMIMFIILGATTFSQILAFTGATSGLAELATSANLSPIVVVIIMQLILIILGMFMEPLSIMMLTVPIYFPVIQAFGYDPVWFGAIMLLNMEMATISPPFGLNLFVMRGVAPKGVTMGDVYAASIPFLLLDLAVMAALLAYPPLVLWLPSLIAK